MSQMMLENQGPFDCLVNFLTETVSQRPDENSTKIILQDIYCKLLRQDTSKLTGHGVAAGVGWPRALMPRPCLEALLNVLPRVASTEVVSVASLARMASALLHLHDTGAHTDSSTSALEMLLAQLTQRLLAVPRDAAAPPEVCQLMDRVWALLEQGVGLGLSSVACATVLLFASTHTLEASVLGLARSYLACLSTTTHTRGPQEGGNPWTWQPAQSRLMNYLQSLPELYVAASCILLEVVSLTGGRSKSLVRLVQSLAQQQHTPGEQPLAHIALLPSSMRHACLTRRHTASLPLPQLRWALLLNQHASQTLADVP